ncbi:hypothetical protein [Methanoregula formicica]|nr:hypothetical protein [Methanoregula formicica]
MWNRIVYVAVPVLLIGLLVLAAGCSEFSIEPRMFSTSFSYDLGITSTEPLSNVTLYLPLPVKNGKPMAGPVILTQQYFENENFSVELVQAPPGINLSGMYPVADNQPWFLKIKAAQVFPDNHNAIFRVSVDNFTRTNSPLQFIETRYPLDNESVFLPKRDFQPLVPAPADSLSLHSLQYSPILISQEIPIYIEYTASPAARVKVSSSIRGGNFWKERYDESGYNSYSDYYSWTNWDESQGWQTAKGKFGYADGPYPNLSHPVWQAVISPTATQ